jgi:hypothetical protein
MGHKQSRQAISPALERLNKAEAILVTLREAGEPLSSADCTNRIIAKHGLAVW